MIATVTFVQKSFEAFNQLCFDGKLPPIPIKLTNARSFLGKVTYVGKRNVLGKVVRFENYCLRISTAFDLSERELEDVVIHEMIHYSIALNGIKDTSPHGEVFRMMMNDINAKFGRHISVRHHCNECPFPSHTEEIRANWLCVSQFQDGNWGITSCAKTKVFEIYRGLPRCYRLKSMTWYGSTDPFFNRYPRSIKPRIYKITRAELDGHLKDAVPLKCDGHTIEPE